MANIVITPLFEQKQREFNVQGQGSIRFRDDFYSSLNRAINRINRDADLETRIARISTSSSTVALDEKYEDILSDGVSLYLHFSGSRPTKGAEALIPMLESRFRDGIARLYSDLFNLRQDADSTDIVIGIDGIE
jgi:hypothetical protein